MLSENHPCSQEISRNRIMQNSCIFILIAFDFSRTANAQRVLSRFRFRSTHKSALRAAFSSHSFAQLHIAFVRRMETGSDLLDVVQLGLEIQQVSDRDAILDLLVQRVHILNNAYIHG